CPLFGRATQVQSGTLDAGAVGLTSVNYRAPLQRSRACSCSRSSSARTTRSRKLPISARSGRAECGEVGTPPHRPDGQPLTAELGLDALRLGRERRPLCGAELLPGLRSHLVEE